MKVRLKFLLIVTIAVVLLLGGVYGAARTFILGNIEKTELQLVKNNILRLSNLLFNEIDSLNSICQDWAKWDDSYEFINDKNKEFIESNLLDSTFQNYKLSFIIFVDKSGSIVYKKGFNFFINQEKQLAEEVLAHITPESMLVKHDTENGIRSGLLMTNSNTIIVSSIPITPSEGGEANGTLIMGRALDDTRKQKLGHLLGFSVTFENIMDNSIPEKYDDFRELRTGVKFISSTVNHGYVNFVDIYGREILKATIETPRYIYIEGKKSIGIFIYAIVVCLTVIAVFGVLIIDKVLLVRIAKLNKFISEVDLDNNPYASIYTTGRDEISSLSQKINQMLSSIVKSEEELKEKEKRLRFVMDGTNDGYWDLIIPKGKIYLNEHLVTMLGLGKDEVYTGLANLYRYVTREDLRGIIHTYEETLRSGSAFYKKEHRLRVNSGDYKWVMIKGKIVDWDSEGQPVRMAGIVSDITEQKRAEEAIRYLSYHDQLTGVYNRTYFNDRLKYLDERAQLPLSIIMGDANGLKLTNDAFGHREGDRLLIRMAEILQTVCSKSDTIARIGGDEFVVILQGVDEEEVGSICNDIQRYCESLDEKPIRPSIALGAALKKSPEEDIHKVMDMAEERMYKNKLLEAKSTRHAIIASLESSLLETDFETREHAERLKVLSVRLGRKLNLRNSKLDELSLLSGLHDIGKIAIPREILMKSGTLNQEEWEVIKKHPEIGYRIAISNLELNSIAEPILYHHERWDGSGYPKGLKGKDIPLLSRIISIVDAYDVITHSRPYKKALTHEEAISEILRCSGSHFDPELVEKYVEMFDETAEAEAI